jgi:hypothetical protein
MVNCQLLMVSDALQLSEVLKRFKGFGGKANSG